MVCVGIPGIPGSFLSQTVYKACDVASGKEPPVGMRLHSAYCTEREPCYACKELVVVSLTRQFCYTVALKVRFPDVQQVALSRVSR